MPPVIMKSTGGPRAEKLYSTGSTNMVVKRHKEKQLIVPDEIKEAKRQFKKQRLDEMQQQRDEA
eukprot:CAMPEP_0185589128 /NCGR_PEP_ID=MMETSP0434-20130131/55712_1 /TAXON_ID=626734 ORGANISM="Favella taraikaensis, Strain Fe Narragansett Bay" /NCGR_SAMPLE_ID=MMETSP0434 /ASSEMBLY_ACC=CAM_ASM_000379 /LENGTH=63 /DNA_ID=CAMNT_0028212261 /DNA_START=87 /DNA_END=278 /DNA_ORIENTATION=+